MALLRTVQNLPDENSLRDDRAGLPRAANDNVFAVVTRSGELYSQTDAKGNLTTLTYDSLGRVLTRSEADLTSSWTYDTATGKGIGQLASATTGTTTYTRSFVYDSLGRPSTVTLTEDGTAGAYTLGYDANGRVLTVGYPSGFTAKYAYTNLGYLYQISDNGGTHQVFWTANTRDAELHLLTQTAGNSVGTTQTFDPDTGLVETIMAGTGATDANSSFSFDSLGNLTSRSWLSDTGATVKENSCYDALNRLTSTRITTGSACTGTGAVTIAYDSLGNITEKTDICATANCFVYGAGAAGPHALSSIVGTYNGVSNPAFTYDSNGNMKAGAGRSVTSTSFNMAASITDGANGAAFAYDSEHARYKQTITGAGAATVYYLNDPVTGTREEKSIVGSTTTWNDYIMADGKYVAERSNTAGTVTLTYFVLDHLGSIAVMMGASGGVLQTLNYDAWGLRRNPDGSAAACGTIAAPTSRGFTGHEMLDGVCLVDMNARIYDPSLGRFMSADPVIEAPYDLQDLNRYSYVLNNPLSLIDPSGYCHGFLGCFFAFATFGLSEFIIAPLLQEFPILGDLFVIAAGAICGPACAATTAAGVAGAEGGKAGQVLRAFVYTFVEAEAFYQAGQFVDSLETPDPVTHVAALTDTEGGALRIGLHGLIGGLNSVAGGGRFASGFLAAGFGALADNIPTSDSFEAGLIIHAVSGGVGSELGGGKFGNGAVTAAFGYLFNKVVSLQQLQEEARNCMDPQCYAQMEQNAEDSNLSLGPVGFDPGRVLGQFFAGTAGTGACFAGACQFIFEAGQFIATNASAILQSVRALTAGFEPVVDTLEMSQPEVLVRPIELPEEDLQETIPTWPTNGTEQSPPPPPGGQSTICVILIYCK